MQRTKIYRFNFICIGMFCLLSLKATSQDIDSTEQKTEVTPVNQAHFPDSIFKFNTRVPIPKRSGMYSALLPGLGQIYNKQYWKAGLVYVGAGVATAFMIGNYKKYNIYRKAFIGRIDNNPSTTDTFTVYTTDDLNILRKGYRQYVEYTIIFSAVGYMINVLDAFISAHLRSFDMSKNISYHAAPFIDERKQVGLKIAFCLN